MLECLLPVAPLLGAASNAWVRPLFPVFGGMVIAIIALLAFFILLRLFTPRVAAIAMVTTKEVLSQPVFWLVIFLGIGAMTLFLFIPFNTFGDDVKMIKCEDLTWIKLLAVILAVWSASTSISEEIDGRTALTILSKPIGRRQFVLGKFVGVIIPVALVFIVLGSWFIGNVGYKVVYDAREVAQPVPELAQILSEMEAIVPGLVLAFLETIILAAISVAISTRLPLIPNMVICIMIYVLGHLVPVIVNSALGVNPLVAFIGNLVAAVLPVLEYFSVEVAIATDQAIPWTYVGMASIYAAIYCAVAMLVALLLMEDRDLA